MGRHEHIEALFVIYTDKHTFQVYIESTYTHTLAVVELTKQRGF